MRYVWYGFLGLFSLGFLGLISAIALVAGLVSYYGSDLPDYSQLKDYKPPIVTRLYAGDGRLLAEFAQEKRVFVPIESIPARVQNAFIAAEDQNFYTHEGVDPVAVLRAVYRNIINFGTGRRPEGASTITQQVAKNFLLTNEVSFERKIKEAILAYRMERAMSKQRLLELYLNEIYMGARAYGVAAASLRYFNKSLSELSIEEAAYLAALPKAPNNYHPVHDKEAAIARRNWVLDRMSEDDYITPAEAELAKLKPLKMREAAEDRTTRAPYFAEEVRRILADKYGEDSLYGGGLVVRTSLDPSLQTAARQSLRDGLIAYDRRWGYRGPHVHFESLDDWPRRLQDLATPAGLLPDWQLAAVLNVSGDEAEIGFADRARGRLPLQQVQWARESRDGGYALGPEINAVSQVLSAGDVIIVSPVEAPDSQAESEPVYELQQIPLVNGALIALDPHTGRILAMQGGWQHGADQFNRATQAERQPGSAFKPFVYLSALERGFTPATLVLDAPFAIEDRPGNIWSPSNYSNEYYGPTPIRVGVEKSRNLMTVRLADFLGMDVIAETAEAFEITDNMKPHLANSLGAAETTILQMTAAYAKLVNGGKDINPTFIDRIQDRRGQTIFRHDDRPCRNCGPLLRWEGQTTPNVPDTRETVTDPRTAYQMVSILEGVVERGTAVRLKSLGRPLAGKTGTTNRSHDAWFIGFSPDLVVGVYVGYDEPRSLGRRETGSSVAVPVFKDFMSAALADKPPIPFRIPAGIRHVQINADTGVRARPGDENVIWESFVVGTEPTDDIFILDGRGVHMMPARDVDPGSLAQEATTGTGGLY